jgi:acetoin utilization deacetylase AcuC-like enzyme
MLLVLMCVWCSHRRYRTLNVPVPENVGDAAYTRLYDSVLDRVVGYFRPDIVILQVEMGSACVGRV